MEIAELTGKRHDHVLRDARRTLNELQSHSPDLGSEILALESTYLSERGREEPCLLLSWLATMTLLSGCAVVLRLKVIKRWAVLEAEKAAAGCISSDLV